MNSTPNRFALDHRTAAKSTCTGASSSSSWTCSWRYAWASAAVSETMAQPCREILRMVPVPTTKSPRKETGRCTAKRTCLRACMVSERQRSRSVRRIFSSAGTYRPSGSAPDPSRFSYTTSGLLPARNQERTAR